MMLDINLGDQQSPPILRPTTQRARVVQSLMDVVDGAALAHGAERFFWVDHVHNCSASYKTPSSMAHDCKEYPHSSACSSKEKKHAFSNRNNSTRWYNSYNSDDCIHLDSGENFESKEPNYVYLQPPILGPSASTTRSNTLRGKVVWEFIHGVTKKKMCMGFLTGIIGHRTIGKNTTFHLESTTLGLHWLLVEHIPLLPPVSEEHKHNYFETLSMLVEIRTTYRNSYLLEI